MQLTPHQEAAFNKLKAFSLAPEARCFVLRGYAGTGKTTLLGAYVRWLRENGFSPVLLATTGRAAKVLADKTGTAATTIHACLYEFDELAGMEEAHPAQTAGQLSINFGMREKPAEGARLVFLVDEASMIANTASSGENLANFGSGHLLIDFLDFTTDHRVVFVGDPCQLPPVSADPFSPALSPAICEITTWCPFSMPNCQRSSARMHSPRFCDLREGSETISYSKTIRNGLKSCPHRGNRLICTQTSRPW
ncbi:MAG: AAA family ATPase [Saprospiraceae bacterium]